MDGHPSDDDKHKTYRYLRQIDDTYVYDGSSGLYKPKTCESETKTEEHTHGRSSNFPFFVQVRRDWLTLIISTFTLAVVSGYTFYAKGQWHEMELQSCIQRNTSINGERAWVGLDVPITIDAMRIQSGKARILGHYSVKNFGHGPALKVIGTGLFITDFSNLDSEIAEANFFCESSVKFATGTVPVAGEMKQPGPFGLTLFTGKDHPELIDFTGPADTTRFLRFVGCVAYLDQFQNIHWTQFCIERRLGDSSPIPKLQFCSMFNETDQPKEQPCQRR